MRSTPILATLGVVAVAVTLSGQTQTDKPPLPKGQMPDLGRPTKDNGATIRIKHAPRVLPPFNDKMTTTVSANGGPFRNDGNPWWRKDTTATT